MVICLHKHVNNISKTASVSFLGGKGHWTVNYTGTQSFITTKLFN